MGFDRDQAYRSATLIRTVEETFLELFAQGRLNGTVHTCLGQEFSALALAHALGPDDYLVSNHRCHGHYLALTDDVAGLVAELMGKAQGLCGGIGSSQHLCDGRFFSNGVQGGMVPVAAGLALACKRRGRGMAVACIGDGTLGQGVVYEAMNLASLQDAPLLLVCENNGWAQTTPTSKGVAGSIPGRAEAFGWESLRGTTDDPEALFALVSRAVAQVRQTSRPLFLVVDTRRLGPHSKGDDTRDPAEIAAHREADPLNRFAAAEPKPFAAYQQAARERVRAVLAELDGAEETASAAYCQELTCAAEADLDPGWTRAPELDERVVQRVNAFFLQAMERDPDILFLGEDVLSPYGGAFKAARGLSERFPDRVLSTPISEAGITGLANGLALAGLRPFVEIMFGDFLTLCLDQLVNHAAKFEHMYNFQVRCPLVLRTPMGGGRGYGPTHSQTLDKLVLGLDNLGVLAVNALADPLALYEALLARETGPVVVLENKIDYGRFVGRVGVPNYVLERSAHAYAWSRLRPAASEPDVTVVAYGGAASVVAESLEALFVQRELLAEVLVPQRIHPLDMARVLASVARTGRLCVVEEGSSFAGWGSEVLARTAEALDHPFQALRIGAAGVPVPSCRELERAVLPGPETIVERMGAFRATA